MNWLKRTMDKIKNPEKNKKLMEWQARYENTKSQYGTALNLMTEYEQYYEGDRSCNINPNNGEGKARKLAINVRNIQYELIESQVDTSIPMPKVTAIHEEDAELAKKIEQFIENVIRTHDFKTLNDLQERTVPIQGGDFFLVEWDNTKGTHCCVGDVAVSTIHPRNLIPQTGVTDIEKMDYVFTRMSQTKEYVKRRFGKDVSLEDETDPSIREDAATEEIVTVVTAYYKNKHGGIGLFSWCGDVVLEDLEDYQARQIEVCKRCGKPRIDGRDTCECGSDKFIQKEDETQKITILEETSIIGMDGSVQTMQEEKEVELPYYKPDKLPIILRKNISRERHLLGFSDVAVIADQQDTIKKLGSQINEKLLMGGSYITLPTGKGVETTDEQYKVIRCDNPQQKSLIGVINTQADCTQDRIILEENYQWAKSSLGITDSFQGKYDSSALSGTAKQYSINQAAGRLESKRVLKNEAYAKLYEMIFKFALAYADQPIPVMTTGTSGELIYSHFDKKDFVKIDASNTPYWNDEFVFETDPTSTLLVNREAMWNQADMKLQSGAFGNIGDLRTARLYWIEQEKNSYPHAGEIRREIEARIKEEQEMAQQMQQAQAQPSEADMMAMMQGGM